MTKEQLRKEIVKIFRQRMEEEKLKIIGVIREGSLLNLEEFEAGIIPSALAEEYIQLVGQMNQYD